MAMVVAGEKEYIATVRSIVGDNVLESDILRALSVCGNSVNAAIKVILNTPGFIAPSITVKRTLTITGARISTQIKQEGSEDSSQDDPVKGLDPKIRVKEENLDMVLASESSTEIVPAKGLELATRVKEEKPDMGFENEVHMKADPVKELGVMIRVNEEPDMGSQNEAPMEVDPVKVSEAILVVKEEKPDTSFENKVSVKEETATSDMAPALVPKGDVIIIKDEELDMGLQDKASMKKEPVRAHRVEPVIPRKETSANTRLPAHPRPFQGSKVKKEMIVSVPVEDGEFPEEPDWFLVGRTTVVGLSTCKGRKLQFNEIVHFAFPSDRRNYERQWVSNRAAAAVSEIVRFSTKQNGEIGRLPMDWARIVIPLVNSSKVKVCGRCIATPENLNLMQEIVLYVSFYIHSSIFTEGDKSSWKLEVLPHFDSTLYPLPALFKLLKIKPYQKAEFTPEDLDNRKRSLNLEGDSDETAPLFPLLKRKKGDQHPEQSNDEQVISESALNKLVGTADTYNLEEMDPPKTLTCDLRPYQKQALYWMTEAEKGIDVEQAAKTLHPCWSAYRICDKRASAIYVNNFSGEATTQFPSATKMARGGILADAMGLGKTVMTIALILANRGRGKPDDEEDFMVTDTAANYEKTNRSNKTFKTKAPATVKAGTLIVCPMALLGQWKDEIETHSEPESLSIFVHYGGDRTNDPKVLSGYDVVLTTYGVLTVAYKNDSNESIFHKVQWFRVVLDEAHTIKSSRTLGALAAFELNAHCRWCLTGTPLQNNLEDLYSLLRFLHVEPWCNWAWWHKLIQRPYESGDERGLKLIKAILRPLMLRRTKETKDKEGRPILVLPPVDIKTIECEQSEAERDFYEALFKRSKVQFDQFVAQGKVLHNYASILELLLRLRQCCNHPFLVMSRGDSQQYADLNKLARRFLEINSDFANPNQMLPTRAYVEEVVEGIRRGENTECPICLEYADDPVLTPCAHRMCRECLLSSWRTPSNGLCPICRMPLKKNELITCPSENRFRVDIEKNWKESCKVSKLLDCLEHIRRKGPGEKSIIFSQWTSFFDILEIPLRKKGIGFLRFDGKLSQKQRERVLREFSETNERRVLLMSLKAGGVGLNLTAASNVFLMDPWWNPAVEEQAIMRIHRIGQKRRVCVRRFIVKDTVEERLQQVQARKQRMIAGALTDQEVRTARIEELKMLFR
uniref:SWI/SNF-related matrix-associated actin-dependent regulator of chromatin subfamily A member 3-like 3 n=1 Tax=Nelumbo nucifera TaxID=4432 RepID=A0A822XLN7_NELNU|nr:TPA_asm: hypothetical protein HUJ06_021309 [Nelumbo nucifera]